MTRIAVLGGGRIGEALLGGLLAAGRTPVTWWWPSGSGPGAGADRVAGGDRGPVDEAVRGAGTVVVAVQAAGRRHAARRGRRSAGAWRARRVAVRGPADLAFRGRPARGHAGRAGHAEHPDAAGRGDVRDLPGRARDPRAPRRDRGRCCPPSARCCAWTRRKQDAATALSGSGPAYFFLVAEAMIEAGVRLGLTRPDATELTVQTALGAARMLRETGEHPAVLRGERHLARRDHGRRPARAGAARAAHSTGRRGHRSVRPLGGARSRLTGPAVPRSAHRMTQSHSDAPCRSTIEPPSGGPIVTSAR